MDKYILVLYIDPITHLVSHETHDR